MGGRIGWAQLDGNVKETLQGRPTSGTRVHSAPLRELVFRTALHVETKRFGTGPRPINESGVGYMSTDPTSPNTDI